MWTSWSGCLATCGFAQSTRQRTCTGGVAGSTGCIGDSFESRSCSLPACIISCEFQFLFKLDTAFLGESEIFQHQICCINGRRIEITQFLYFLAWAQWSLWSSCSVTCGVGSQSRSRACNNGFAGDAGCPGLASEQRTCNAGSCGGEHKTFYK